LTTTTKIFIILVCLFAFIFTPLAIQFAARTNDWQNLATSWQQRSETDDAYARSVQSVASSEIAHAMAIHTQDQDRLANARRQIDDLSQQVASLTADRDGLALDRDKAQTASELQAGTNKVLTAHFNEITKANRDLTASELDLKTRNIQLNDRVKELSAQLVVLQQQLNQRQQELAMAREENANLRNQKGMGPGGEYPYVGSAPPVRATTPPSRGPIQGHVKSVQGNLATIDVGSSSGVKEGMTMVVTREGNWVCDLRITSQVSPNEAVGEVRSEQNRHIRPDDTVKDEVSFNAEL
jgi:hypothetical protein